MKKLAIVLSHPIQYNAPWFRYLAVNGFDGLRVFYLWDGGSTEKMDRGFGRTVKWDIPLLEGYDHEFVPNVARSPGTDFRSGLDNPELPRRLAAFQPDAILLFGYNYRTHYRLIFSRHRVPLLFRGDSHRLRQVRSGERGVGSGVGGLKEWLRRQWISTIYRRFDAFLPVGQANRDYFKQHGVPEAKLFFSPHAVDNDRFHTQAESAFRQAAEWKTSLGIPASHQVILFAGKFEAIKRPRDLLAAFKLAGLKETTLLLVGSGEQAAELRRDAADLPDIVFAPFQNQTQMPRTYAAGDVFVLPSYSETWGLAVNEAMCLGRPVIVSSHVGCGPDLVRPRQNGLIFPAGDVPALAGALREAFAEPERLKAWGAHSREIIQGYSYVQATAGLREALAAIRRDY